MDFIIKHNGVADPSFAIRSRHVGQRHLFILCPGRLEENLKKRYKSFYEGIGKTVLDGSADLCSLAAHAEQLGDVKNVESGRQEYLESIVNQILFLPR